jgi:hypothetical protein
MSTNNYRNKNVRLGIFLALFIVTLMIFSLIFGILA